MISLDKHFRLTAKSQRKYIFFISQILFLLQLKIITPINPYDLIILLDLQMDILIASDVLMKLVFCYIIANRLRN